MKFKKKKKETIATMPNLPEEILQEIFLRLPTRSLSRFKCVSKSFCALFRSRSFQNLHHELSNITSNTSILFCRDNPPTNIYRLDYVSVSSLLSSPTSQVICDRIMNYPSLFQHYVSVTFLSSCNGLVWVSLTPIDLGEDEFYIWNPSTKVYKQIPMAPLVAHEENEGIYGHAYGLCYDYKTGNYKLVRVVSKVGSKCFDVDVYTLGSNAWRSIQGMPYYLYYNFEIEEVLFNGALHWLALTIEEKSTVLIRFDIINERFEEVALPKTPIPYPEEPMEKNMFALHVAVFGGCLCLVFHVPNIRVDIWMMQDYGLQESWTKSFSITEEYITSCTCLELVWSFKNNEILWEADGAFILYEPKTKTYRNLEVANKGYVARHYMVNSVPL